MATNLRAKSAYSPLAFQNGLEYRSVDGHVNNGNDLATSCENLVNFSEVTPEFSRVVEVHHIVNSTGISLATFDWWRHCYTLRESVLSFVSLLFARGGESLLCRAGYKLGSATHFWLILEKNS